MGHSTNPRKYFVVILIFLLICFGECNSSGGTTKIPSAVLELNDRFLEVKHEGHWFVEFYAPWCGHCKRLHPIWEQVGHALQGTEIRVARLDCTRFTKVSSEVGIHGFPTIKYYRNGEDYPYDGDRTKKAIVDFAMKVYGPHVRMIQSEGKYKETLTERKASGFFLFVSDSKDKDASQEFQDMYNDVAKEMFTKTYFYSVSDQALPKDSGFKTIPGIYSIKDTLKIAYEPSTQPVETLKEWVNNHRWPLFPEITYGTLYDMGLCCGKFLVMAVSDVVKKADKKSPVYKFHRMVEETSRRYKKILGNKFFFGWLDGSEMADNIVMGSMKVPSLLVFNASSYEFFLPQDSPEKMTEESLMLYLDSVAKGEYIPMGGRGWLQRIRRMVFEIYSALYTMFATQPLLSCCLFGLPLGILSIICYTLCSADASVDSDEIYKDSDEDDSDYDDHEKRE